MERPHLKLSELRDYLDKVIKEHGDLDVSLTLPGWYTGAEDPESQAHSWDFGIYILTLSDTDEDGNVTTQEIASLGHLGDYDDDEYEKPSHLKLVE